MLLHYLERLMTSPATYAGGILGGAVGYYLLGFPQCVADVRSPCLNAFGSLPANWEHAAAIGAVIGISVGYIVKTAMKKAQE